MNDTHKLLGLVRKAETDWISGETQYSEFVSGSLYDDINKIEAYLNSKHTSGESDSLGREKPFFNIVLAKRNIWYRATDVDRKNIRAKANKVKDYITSFIFNLHVVRWMNDNNFGKFLNDWGLYLASYNSAVVKFVKKDGKLHSDVIPWNRMIVDSIDFENNPKIEVLELTPAQLRKRKGYDQEQVEKLIETESSRENPNREKKDQKENYIKLYEVHGELALSFITGKEEDDDTFVQQMQVVSFVEGKGKGEFDDFVLYKGKEDKDPYMLTYLIPSVDGSISLNGAVKTLFDAQWMRNHTVKSIKDQLDLASKLIFQTADTNFVGQNALTSIENGNILVHKENMPLTQVANSSHDITSLQSFGQQWEVLAQEITSTPDILEGSNMPSGTAYRQAAIIQQESHSNFEIMIENKGLFLEEMFREHITPFLLKKMDTTDEISATLDQYGIDKIDKMYISSKVAEVFNRKAVDAVLNDEEVPELDEIQANVEKEVQEMGEQRFIKPSEIADKTWKEVIGEFEGEIIYEITDENSNKQAVMDTLSTVFNTLVSNPGIEQNKTAMMLLGKILEETGKISPVEIESLSNHQPQQQPAELPIGGGKESTVGQVSNQFKQ
ncbi:MAG: hypothetical protein GY861_18275 [bacterium]|nr:hypothetical protein [bacterium]